MKQEINVVEKRNGVVVYTKTIIGDDTFRFCKCVDKIEPEFDYFSLEYKKSLFYYKSKTDELLYLNNRIDCSKMSLKEKIIRIVEYLGPLKYSDIKKIMFEIQKQEIYDKYKHRGYYSSYFSDSKTGPNKYIKSTFKRPINNKILTKDKNNLWSTKTV